MHFVRLLFFVSGPLFNQIKCAFVSSILRGFLFSSYFFMLHTLTTNLLSVQKIRRGDEIMLDRNFSIWSLLQARTNIVQKCIYEPVFQKITYSSTSLFCLRVTFTHSAKRTKCCSTSFHHLLSLLDGDYMLLQWDYLLLEWGFLPTKKILKK